MGFDQVDKLTGNSAEVIDRKLQVNMPRIASKAPYIIAFSESDPGEITGVPLNRCPETSRDYRSRVGIDTLKFTETFNYAAQNTHSFHYRTSTLTTTWSSGYMVLNGGNSGAAGSTCGGSYKTFPMMGTAPLSVEYSIAMTAIPPAAFLLDFGIASAFSTSAPYAATDGIYIRATSGGMALIGNYAGNEQTLGTFTYTVVPNQNTKVVLVIDERGIEVWCNDALYLKVDVPDGQGQCMASGAGALYWRLVNTGVTSACQAKISDITVTMMDVATSQPWADALSGMGLNAGQSPPGATVASTNNITTSIALPTATALLAASAIAATLGGQASILPTLTVATHGQVFAYTNPASSATYTGRLLKIKGVWLDSFVSVVLAGGPVIYDWSIAYGQSAVTLATAESATAKKPTFIELGLDIFPLNAAQYTRGNRIYVPFDFPICLNAGESIALCARNMGVVTTTGAITVTCGFNGVFE